jgi:hypothetical protein
MPPALPSLRFGVAALLLVLSGWGVSAAPPGVQPQGSHKPAAKNHISKVAPKTELAASLIRSHKRAPIPYKAFDMCHPGTGKECKPEDMLTLPNGKRVRAKDYFDQLNHLEKRFNALGHSLRHTADKVLLQETRIDTARLDAHARTVAAKHRTFDPKTMRRPTPLKDLPAAHRAAVKKASSHPKGPAAPAGGRKTRDVGLRLLAAPEGVALAQADGGNTKGDREHQPFNFTVGDKKTASVFLDGRWDVNVSPAVLDLSSEAHAGAYLVNQRVELFTATVAVHAEAGANGSAKVTVSALGQVIHNLNEPFQTTWQKGDQVSHTVDFHVPFSFFLGPIRISVEVGARGGVGLNYFLGVSTQPLHATAQVVPNASVDAYAQAGIDIKIVSAGVKADLQLLHFALTLGAEAGVKSEAQGPTVHLFVHGDNELTLLSGSLSFFAEVFVPAFKLPPFEKKRFDHNFFSWTGFKKQGSLFNVQRDTPAGKAPGRAPAPAPAEALAQAAPKASLFR